MKKNEQNKKKASMNSSIGSNSPKSSRLVRNKRIGNSTTINCKNRHKVSAAKAPKNKNPIIRVNLDIPEPANNEIPNRFGQKKNKPFR